MSTEELKTRLQVAAMEAIVYGVQTTCATYNNCTSVCGRIAGMAETLLATPIVLPEPIQLDLVDEDWELVDVQSASEEGVD